MKLTDERWIAIPPGKFVIGDENPDSTAWIEVPKEMARVVHTPEGIELFIAYSDDDE